LRHEILPDNFSSINLTCPSSLLFAKSKIADLFLLMIASVTGSLALRLLLKAFSENLVEGDTKKSIKNYLKNLNKYRQYLKDKEKTLP
jgi:ATP/ADP translocase